MTRIALVAAVCTLTACAISTQSPKPEPIPKESIPAGFSAAECHVVKSAEAMTEESPDGTKYTTGTRSPEVSCQHHEQGPVTVTTTPTCKTKAGADLPLSDCCLNTDGSTIPACTPKIQPAGE